MSSAPLHTLADELVVVIGSGGVLGIAWSVGVIAGLAQQHLPLDKVALWIGTSAGAIVAAKLAHQIPIADLWQAQLSGQAAAHESLRPYDQTRVDRKNQELFAKVQGNLSQARQRIGAWAQRNQTPDGGVRRRIIAQRLQGLDWPHTALSIVSVNAHTGERAVWNRYSGVRLHDAVAASCAVPGVWPVVALHGEAHIDGGVYSMTNADLATGYRQVLILSPQGDGKYNPISGHLRSEVLQLRAHGASVQVIVPNAQCLHAMGDNILDPTHCAPVALAAYQQGLSDRTGTNLL